MKKTSPCRERQKSGNKRRILCMLLSTTRLGWMSFSPVCLHPAGEKLQNPSNTGAKILNQCFCRLLEAGLAFDAATSDVSERKRKICTRKQLHSPSNPSLSFSPYPLLSFCLSFFPPSFSCLPLSLSHLACLKIQSSSLDVKGGEFSTCVLPFHLRKQGEESWGKSGVLMTAECALWVMPSAGICSTRIKLFTSKTHCLLPDRAAERGGRMMEKHDELNIRRMECLREKEKQTE